MDDFYRYTLMSMTNMVVGPFITVAVSLPVVFYIVARWRTYRDYAGGDPQLGLKVALCFFRLASFQLVLAGLFCLVYGSLTDMGDSAREGLHRTAGGLLVPGLLVYAVHAMLLNRTNWREMPAVVRMFNGMNLINTGILGFAGLVFALFLLFQKDVPGEIERLAWSMVLVYTAAWGVLGVLFAQNTMSGGMPEAVASYSEPRGAVTPPAPPPAAPPARTGGDAQAG